MFSADFKCKKEFLKSSVVKIGRLSLSSIFQYGKEGLRISSAFKLED